MKHIEILVFDHRGAIVDIDDASVVKAFIGIPQGKQHFQDVWDFARTIRQGCEVWILK